MRLREMREKLGLTQVELAKALKVSQVTISRWETDAMAIQQPEILRLAVAHLRCKKRPLK
jgi:transcriptional regulator with XRE-family HTH domain